MATRPKVIRPSLGWFLLLDGGLITLAALCTNESLHTQVSEAAPIPLPPQSRLKKLLAGAILAHVVEALIGARMASRRGLPKRGWTLQSFVVGFPSLLQLRKIPIKKP
jgi:Domain of unknown function (DUF4499)